MAWLVIDIERCKGCGLCVEFCPRDNLRLSENLAPSGVYPAETCEENNCNGCGMCVLMCPHVAIEIYHEKLEEAKQS